MLEYYRVAMEIAHAQSKLRPMDNDGLMRLIGIIYKNISIILNEGGGKARAALAHPYKPYADEAHKSVRLKSIICLECGREFRALTGPHLASHGLDAESYREKWGFRKNMPLACHELRLSRRRTMEGLQLWKNSSLRRMRQDQSKG